VAPRAAAITFGHCAIENPPFLLNTPPKRILVGLFY
jgi:hypothetical protein